MAFITPWEGYEIPTKNSRRNVEKSTYEERRQSPKTTSYAGEYSSPQDLSETPTSKDLERRV